MDIVVWLWSLGLGKYEAIFREKTHENLKDQLYADRRSPCANAARTSRGRTRSRTWVDAGRLSLAQHRRAEDITIECDGALLRLKQ